MSFVFELLLNHSFDMTGSTKYSTWQNSKSRGFKARKDRRWCGSEYVISIALTRLFLTKLAPDARQKLTDHYAIYVASLHFAVMTLTSVG